MHPLASAAPPSFSAAALRATERYTLSLASDTNELEQAQRLRFRVFNLELNQGLVASHVNGLDADAFDPVCDHLLVSDVSSGEVVGTYRLQTGSNAAHHRGFYGAGEFSFAPYESVRAELIELGRACVAAGHRNQSVLALLWRGIVWYARQHHARYLIGCSSILSQDETAALSTYRGLAANHLVQPRWRTRARPAHRCAVVPGASQPLPIPRLMAAYLSLGAKICGEPAIDRDFGTIDFLTWLDLQTLPEPVLRRYLS